MPVNKIMLKIHRKNYSEIYAFKNPDVLIITIFGVSRSTGFNLL